MTAKYPLPWVVGPFGCVWVAADVEFKDGKWRETRENPRLVVDTGENDRELAEFIVASANSTVSETSVIPQTTGDLK